VLEDLSALFREALADTGSSVSLAEEIDLAQRYLAIEQVRYGDRLRVEWHTTSMPAEALVPPLVLQPLVENAVYHGIEPLSAPGTISINIFARDGEVHTILRNPYRPDNDLHRAGNKMAFANVRERLALHFDVEAGLDATARGDSYEVHIRMPYRPAPGRAASGRGAAASGAGPAKNGGGA
jgi:two-component system sensor histidine kinase AlgZ